MSGSGLEEELARAVGAAHVLTDRDLKAPFETDWTGRYAGAARAVVRPADTAEISEVVRICARHGAAIVPQGGNTGLAGGATPGFPGGAAGGERGGEVVLVTTRLNWVGTVDPATMQVEVGAGATLADLQEAAREAGLDAAFDLGARDTATVGGLVACDAGGTYSVRFGTAADRIAGLEAVLADGSVVRRMSGLLKDNAGYDLAALLAGSEGTLGIVTAVRWHLEPIRRPRVAALVGLGSFADAAALIAHLRPRLPELVACDFLTGDCLALACERLAVASPLAGDHEVYVLLEVAGGGDPLKSLAEAFDAMPPQSVAIADDTADRERLWALREAVPEAIAALGVPHKLDVGVPLERLPDFAEGVVSAVAASGAPAESGGPAESGAGDPADGRPRVLLFGHLGDGNVHVNIVGLDRKDTATDDAVLELSAELGGTISAEHGIGKAKAARLGLSRSPAELEAMRAIKRALDPKGLLNPGAVLPPDAR